MKEPAFNVAHLASGGIAFVCFIFVPPLTIEQGRLSPFITKSDTNQKLNRGHPGNDDTPVMDRV